MQREIVAPLWVIGSVPRAYHLLFVVELSGITTGLYLKVKTHIYSDSARGLESKKFVGLFDNQLAIPNKRNVNRQQYRLQMPPSGTFYRSCMIYQIDEGVAGTNICKNELR